MSERKGKEGSYVEYTSPDGKVRDSGFIRNVHGDGTYDIFFSGLQQSDFNTRIQPPLLIRVASEGLAGTESGDPRDSDAASEIEKIYNKAKAFKAKQEQEANRDDTGIEVPRKEDD